MVQRFSQHFPSVVKNGIFIFSVVILFSGCGKNVATEQKNTNVQNNTNGTTSDSAKPYIFPSYVYPEQIGDIARTESGVLFAPINEINKYAHPEAIELYNLNPRPEISDEYNFLGILRSEDNGVTWTEALRSKQDQDHKKLEHIATCREKNGKDVVYAHFRSLRADNTTEKSGSFHLYVSRDVGKKWDDNGTFALKKGSGTEVILATYKDQSQIDGIPLDSLRNIEVEGNSCERVRFENTEKTDVIQSGDYGKTWERVKK